VAKRSDAGWEDLRRELSARVGLAPDWTERSGSDPGITLVELFGFLAESLLSRPDLSPHARTRLNGILARLEREVPPCDDGTLTRNRYFTGKRLTTEDFEQEQAYHRTKHRRHNRLLHGVGIVRGLGVGLDSRPGSDEPAVVVSPGLAISPEGEELVVCEPVTRAVCPDSVACHVTLALVERPTDPTADGEPSRIDESADVAVAEDVPTGHLAIARLIRDGGVWRFDPGFEALRVT
jgi:hypothetical protein